MASNSKSGLSKIEREKFLHDHGFVKVREAQGSHTIWEHPELKALAKTQKVNCPANLLHNPAQLPWEHTIPDNPASGTWHRISKHAQWCQETVETAQIAQAAEERRRQIKQEFRDSLREICDWKREAKHRYKFGLDQKPAPDAVRRLPDLKAQL